MARKESAGQVAPFLDKLYKIVEDADTKDVVNWKEDGQSFVVKYPEEFAKRVLPRYFKHNNYSSFVRQLNIYGFRKIDPDSWVFQHPDFRRGDEEGLKHIHRRKPPASSPITAGTDIMNHPSIEIGNFGGGQSAGEHLARDKEVLVNEVYRLRSDNRRTVNVLKHVIAELLMTKKKQEQTDANVRQIMTFLGSVLESKGIQHSLFSKKTPALTWSGSNLPNGSGIGSTSVRVEEHQVEPPSVDAIPASSSSGFPVEAVDQALAPDGFLSPRTLDAAGGEFPPLDPSTLTDLEIPQSVFNEDGPEDLPLLRHQTPSWDPGMESLAGQVADHLVSSNSPSNVADFLRTFSSDMISVDNNENDDRADGAALSDSVIEGINSVFDANGVGVLPSPSMKR